MHQSSAAYLKKRLRARLRASNIEKNDIVIPDMITFILVSSLDSGEHRQDVFSCLPPTLLHTIKIIFCITTQNGVEWLNLKHFNYI